MSGEVQALIARVPERDASIRVANIHTYSLPTSIAVHPDARRTGVYDMSGAGPIPETPLFIPRGNRPETQVTAVFEVFEDLLLREKSDWVINAESVNQAFTRFATVFSTLELSESALVEHLPLHTRGTDTPMYYGYTPRDPTYILYIDRFGGDPR